MPLRRVVAHASSCLQTDQSRRESALLWSLTCRWASSGCQCEVFVAADAGAETCVSWRVGNRERERRCSTMPQSSTPTQPDADRNQGVPFGFESQDLPGRDRGEESCKEAREKFSEEISVRVDLGWVSGERRVDLKVASRRTDLLDLPPNETTRFERVSLKVEVAGCMFFSGFSGVGRCASSLGLVTWACWDRVGLLRWRVQGCGPGLR